ncbi:hypothetical protein [Methylorubrum thiocyanatum]|uniref:hypothetical protein n=1 Tax=Methylorubrum thiocyanatum TaxID=47958 RepID=UPI00364999F8
MPFIPSGLEKAKREHLVEVVREVERIATEAGSDVTPAQRRILAEPVTVMIAEIAVLDGALNRDEAGLQPYVAGIARTLGISREEAFEAWHRHGQRVVNEAAGIMAGWQARTTPTKTGKGKRKVPGPRPHFPTWANVFTTLKEWREAGILTRDQLQRVFGREACVAGRVRIAAGISFETRSPSATWQDTRIADFARDLSAAHEFGEAMAGKVFAEQAARARKVLH